MTTSRTSPEPPALFDVVNRYGAGVLAGDTREAAEAVADLGNFARATYRPDLTDGPLTVRSRPAWRELPPVDAVPDGFR